jgi:putative tryptophan/tyrosine transport system substrate-binding protein
MRRRDFMRLVGGGAAAWPLAARAQQRSAMPVVGFLGGESPETWAGQLSALRQGLRETGFVEGGNVAVEYRWARGRSDRLAALAADLVRRQANVLVTAGGTPAVRAAKAATSTIPIVFTTGTDPVQLGFVDSMNRPGGNVTGVTILGQELAPKRVELLHELVPAATLIAALVNPTNPNSEALSRNTQAAARTFGLQLRVLHASSEDDFDRISAILAQERPGALLVNNEPFLLASRDRIIALAARLAIPTMFEGREYVTAGGLMSYGASTADAYRQAGVYVGKILTGEKPADLPVMQPTKFELVINLKTAKALGVTIPLTLQYAADEVIE